MEEKLKCVVPNSREDGIRELPETVLLHILSYLPIKDLIRTSIVAKQWRNLWKSVPSLKFNISLCTRESNKQYSEKKLDFVDKVFKCRDSFALPEFHLSYSDTGKVGTSFPRRFKVWIEVVARLKPRLVDLYLRSPLRSLQLPTMEALEMLKLRVHNIGYETFNLKSLSGLHSLKILKLEGVDFCLGELSDLPILEELHLRYCHFVASFILEGPNIFVFDKLSSLSNLVLDNRFSRSFGVDKLSKIIAGCSVNTFFWSCTYIVWSALVEELHASVATPFANLKSLFLPFYCCYCDDYVESVIYLLQSCPKLEKLVIKFEARRHHGKNECFPTKDPPKFALPSLWEIEVAHDGKDEIQCCDGYHDNFRIWGTADCLHYIRSDHLSESPIRLRSAITKGCPRRPPLSRRRCRDAGLSLVFEGYVPTAGSFSEISALDPEMCVMGSSPTSEKFGIEEFKLFKDNCKANWSRKTKTNNY
ncbi:hypothetical protein H6P81_019352 [Aristolochia fimbriata]|uniref:F-box domain-containing protein n=1 Tax=Aristolochia fimbriata TaxID=158543 RepID=A0AAV7DUM1_ARIFI|nr:hypothetical protein H6P81_019352 [Aristolochia fimbriata]